MNEVTKRYDWCAGNYVIVKDVADKYRWVWQEPGVSPDISEFGYLTIHEALRAAAEDWDKNGDAGTLSKNLRLAATQYEKVGK